MPYEVSKFCPQTWNIALNLEHWDKISWANCSPSGARTINILSIGGKEKKESCELESQEMSDQGNTLPPLIVSTSWHWKVAENASCVNSNIR